MKNIRFKISILLFAIMILFTFSASAISIDEWSSTQSYRWYNVITVNGTKQCYVLTNGDYLNETDQDPTFLGRRYQHALSHWASNSGGKANFVNTDFSSSKLDMLVVRNANTWQHGNSISAIAYLMNSSNQWSNSTNPYGSGGFLSGIAIQGAIHYAPHATNITSNNETMTVSQQQTVDYFLLHEMGHILGMGHCSDGITSIMSADRNTAYRSWTITSRDIEQLRAMYP